MYVAKISLSNISFHFSNTELEYLFMKNRIYGFGDRPIKKEGGDRIEPNLHFSIKNVFDKISKNESIMNVRLHYFPTFTCSFL